MEIWAGFCYNEIQRTCLFGSLSAEMYGMLGKRKMNNPWEEIPLTDYKNHMKLDSVMQLQAMNEMMKGQLDAYPVPAVMIFGIAGGNGLAHIRKDTLSCQRQIWSSQIC